MKLSNLKKCVESTNKKNLNECKTSFYYPWKSKFLNFIQFIYILNSNLKVYTTETTSEGPGTGGSQYGGNQELAEGNFI